MQAYPGPLKGRVNTRKRNRTELTALYRAAVARKYETLLKKLRAMSPEVEYLIDFRPRGLEDIAIIVD